MNIVELVHERMDGMKILEYYSFDKISVRGNIIRACCKIHNGDNPTAFVWNTTNNLWFCHTHSCGGGDAFELVMKLENCNFVEATNILCRILNIDNKDNSYSPVSKKTSIENEQSIFLKKYLKENKEFEEYIITKEGSFNNLNSFDRFDIECRAYYGAKFYKVYEDKNIKIFNKLVIPIVKENKVVGIACRDTTGVYKPKWYYAPQGMKIKNTLYNIDKVIEMINNGCTNIILCEGIFDVWAYHRVGIDNAVAVFGSSISEEQIDIILKLGVDVFLSFDNDDAGNKAAFQCKKAFNNYCNVKRILLPEGKDPADVTKEELFNAYLNAIGIRNFNISFE